MMELMERKSANEERKLPRNIRQIGEPGQGIKVLIEDYAYTFLRQLAQENLTCIRTAILIGEANETEIYIRGIVDIDMGQEPKGWFSHEHWRMIFQEVHDWYEGMEVVGWYMANPGFPPVLTEELQNLHIRNFSSNQHIFFQMDVLENEEVFYIRGESGLAPLCGYYIFYEKNEQMQAYMSQKKGGAGIEPEGILRDRAAARFRNVMQEKKEQSTQKKTLAFLYTSCTFLVMVILVIGITMVNNYDRMSNMENAIHQISENLENTDSKQPLSSEGSIEEAMEAENQQALAQVDPSAIDTQTESAEPEGQATSEEPQTTEEEGKTEESGTEENVPEETEQGGQEEPEEPTESQAQSEEPLEDDVQSVMSSSVKEPERYQVQAGDTLLEISRSRYGNDEMVNEICKLNELEDGNKIYVGEIILLP